MSSTEDFLFSGDDLFAFAEETAVSAAAAESGTPVRPWKILIVDDDRDVHTATSMVFDEITFDGATIMPLHAYSGREAVDVLREHPDVAVVLLDVVMETDDAGLDVARRIRHEFGNDLVRIILRTGQPGKAPEKAIITMYEINDYKDKTELTVAKLYTTIVSSLRSYRDMTIIDRNRRGLEKIISSSASLLDSRTLQQFSESILSQLVSLMELDGGTFYRHSAFAATSEKEGLRVLSARGGDISVDRAELPDDVMSRIELVLFQKESMFFEDSFVGYFGSSDSFENIVYVSGTKELRKTERDLIRVFCNNVAIAFDNIFLNMEIMDTQKEMVLKMGDIIETRSKETANHVYRVAEYSYLIAREAGLSDEEATILRHASPMHDSGKVGIPDAILLKPGKLTEEEYEVIKTHTVIGEKIFGSSSRAIIRAAAIVAMQHHERWDGKGYPRGLAGGDIHIYGRITALADVFDALSHKRGYKDAWSMEETLAFLSSERGRQFDPDLVDAFFRIRDNLLDINERYPD